MKPLTPINVGVLVDPYSVELIDDGNITMHCWVAENNVDSVLSLVIDAKLYVRYGFDRLNSHDEVVIRVQPRLGKEDDLETALTLNNGSFPKNWEGSATVVYDVFPNDSYAHDEYNTCPSISKLVEVFEASTMVTRAINERRVMLMEYPSPMEESKTVNPTEEGNAVNPTEESKAVKW